MKVIVVLMSAVLGYAQGAMIGAPASMMRTPQFDSAVIQSERLGGNFAYSSMEAHAYSAVSPVVENVPTQVGVSYQEKPIFGQVTYHEPAQAAIIPAAPIAVAAPAYYPAAPAYYPAAPAYYPVAPVFADYKPIAGPMPVPVAPAPAPAPAMDSPASSPFNPSAPAPAMDSPASSPFNPSAPAPAMDSPASSPFNPAGQAPASESSDDSVTIEAA